VAHVHPQHRNHHGHETEDGMNLLLHPTISAPEAKRLATEHGCLLTISGGRLKLKQRRHRRGLDAFESKAIRNSMCLANRSFAMLELGNYEGARREIRKAMNILDELLPADAEA
jgi:hypothetical protein